MYIFVCENVCMFMCMCDVCVPLYVFDDVCAYLSMFTHNPPPSHTHTTHAQHTTRTPPTHNLHNSHTQQVAKHFKDVFAELVPGGRGELVMQTSAQVRHADQENMGVDGAGDGGRLDKYVGVKVKVRV